MRPTRRNILGAAGAVTAMATLTGCEKILSKVTEHFGQTVPETVAVPASPDIDPAHHLLSRAGFGPWPGDLDQVRSTGEKDWLEQQLNPDSIDDAPCALRTRRFEELQEAAGECYEYTKPVLRADMARHTLLRALYSKRQLQ